MYIPKHFEVRDANLLYALMQRFSFATVVSTEDGLPVATHLPLLIKRDVGTHGSLIGHFSRANIQWRTFSDTQEVLTIFQGHHAYISPSWYTQHPSVPTWNYMIVHAYGVPRIITAYDEIVAALGELVTTHEAGFAQPWPMNLEDAYMQKQVNGIVAFEIQLTRLEGKFKLSQNRSLQDQAQVIAALEQSSDAVERELAGIMKTL